VQEDEELENVEPHVGAAAAAGIGVASAGVGAQQQQQLLRRVQRGAAASADVGRVAGTWLAGSPGRAYQVGIIALQLFCSAATSSPITIVTALSKSGTHQGAFLFFLTTYSCYLHVVNTALGRCGSRQLERASSNAYSQSTA
jgi:hypothetical protein